MRRRNGFRPAALIPLECRVVPSSRRNDAGPLSRCQWLATASASVELPSAARRRRGEPGVHVLHERLRPGPAQTYFASIQNVPNPSAATTMVFTLYIQTASLLAGGAGHQQLFLQSPKGTARANGQTPALEQLVSKKLINPTGQVPPGSLGRSLVDTIPPPGTSAATASLYSLTQDDAIQSAQVAVVNAMNIIKDGDFGNQTSSNHK